MIATTVRLALVAAAASSLTSAFPLFHFDRKEAVAVVRRAENDGQLAQGTNYYFSTLHLEDVCTPGQVACVSGNYATCSAEGNWEISPCASGTTCLATPASSSSGVSVQCTSQTDAQSAIQNAGGSPNTVAADFHVTDAPFSAETIPDPAASSSSSSASSDSASATDSATDSASATESSAAPTDAPTATESSEPAPASSTCTPGEGEGEGDDDGTIADGPTDTQTQTDEPTATPTGTCTDEEPIETETITVIVVPVPSQTGVYSTTTLFPEEPESTITESDPEPTESSSDSSESPAPTDSNTESSSAPTESTPTESTPEPTATEVASSSDSASDVSSSSGTAEAVTTIYVQPGFSIAPLPTGAGDATVSVPIPIINVVGTHTIPAKRMVRVVRRA